MFGAASRHDKVFYKAFADHAQHMVEATKLVEGWLSSGEDPDRLRQRVSGVRASAGKVLRDSICELRKTWITPFDAQDIRTLLLSLDGVVEMVKATTERAVLFRLPDGQRGGVERDAGRLAEILGRCCATLEQALALLPQKKKEQEILACCEQVRSLERDADVAYREALARLYDGGALSAEHPSGSNGEGQAAHILSMIKWREVYDGLEEATDRCSHIALHLEAMVEAHG